MPDGATNSKSSTSAQEVVSPPKPQLNLLGMHVEDMSLESPGAVDGCLRLLKGTAPANTAINLRLDVDPVPGQLNVFEVRLSADVTNSLPVEGGTVRTLYRADAVLVGVFGLVDVPAEMQDLLLKVVAPNQLFPYLRELIQGITARTGFGATLLPVVDFANFGKSQAA